MLSARPPRSAPFVASATSSSASVGAKPLLGRQPLDLLAELRDQLVVVVGDQRPAVEREVVGRERVDRSPHDVRDARASPPSAASSYASRVTPSRRAASASSAASRAKSEAGQAAASARRSRIAARQPRAGEPEGKDLLGVHGSEATS